MIAGAFALAGAAAGVAQAVLLGRAVRAGAGPFGFLLRLLLVGAVLVASAPLGQLPAAAAGWAIGLVSGGVVSVRRWS